jgi:hypothetical protein
LEDEGRGIGGRFFCEDVGGIYVGIYETFVKKKDKGKLCQNFKNSLLLILDVSIYSPKKVPRVTHQMGWGCSG